MDSSMQNAAGNSTRWRVSVLTRLAAVLAYAVPLIGAALSSFLLIRNLQALKSNEAAGIMAVMAAVKEATQPVSISLYVAAFLGLIVLVVLVARAFQETKTASPPVWFFVLCGILSLVPAGLFWRAEWLLIQALSPGSAVGSAEGGIAAVLEQIASLLVMSTVSVPIIFVLFVIAFAMPFSSKSRLNPSALTGAVLVLFLLIAAAVAAPWLIGEPQRKKEIVALPVDFKTAEDDYDLRREASVILLLTSDNKLYIEKKPSKAGPNGKTEEPVTLEELPGKLRTLMEDKTPEKRIVYLKADVNTEYKNVRRVFEIVRKVDIDRIGLVVYGDKNLDDPYQLYPKRFEARLPEDVSQSMVPPKPNPLLLVASLGKDGALVLNKESKGTISDPAKLISALSKVFKQREGEGFFREGTNEIEKTVFLKAAESGKYGDFINLVEAVKLSGAEPIGIQMDEDRF